MSLIVRTPKARDDLRSIWGYVADEAGEEVATRFLESVEKQMVTLWRFPKMGRRYDSVYPKLRAFPIGDYIIFYRSLSEERGIEIIRVLHGKRDVEAEVR